MTTADNERTDTVLKELREVAFGIPVSTQLETDEQVMARVTDGIYRQPSSAFRELITNAYDADATRVIIKTDAPRFDRITIEDDGNGMNEESIVNLLHHIGGSAKRKEKGAELGVASSNDFSLSPGGRKLIGKIGIGLFSVSQLTQTFHIITKFKGANYRIFASIVLRQYDGLTVSDNYESGRVKIWLD